MNYVILAAGRGERLRADGIETPKPLVCIDGVPLVKRLIDLFRSTGGEEIVVVVNKADSEVICYLDGVKNSEFPGLTIIVDSPPTPVVSLMLATRALPTDSAFIASTVDTVFNEKSFQKYVREAETFIHRSHGIFAVTEYVDDEKPLWIETDSQGNIANFSSNNTAGCKYVSAGVYGLSTACLSLLERCVEGGMTRLRDFQQALLNNGYQIKAFDMGKVVDIDRVTDLRAAQSI